MKTQNGNSNGHNPWDDVPTDASHVTGEAEYPFIQWITGDPKLKKVHPVLGSGGFGMPVEQFAAATLDGVVPDFFTSGTVTHKSGDETEMYLADGLTVAVLAYRFGWATKTPGGQERINKVYSDHARGKLQVLVLVKGFGTLTPVLLTFKGMASRHVLDTLKSFRQQIIGPANAFAKRKFPLYAFWMEVKAGARREEGQPGATSFTTPPEAAWNAEALKDADKRKDYLRGLFVGKDVIAQAEAYWEAAQEWAVAWQSDEGVVLGNGEDDTPPMPEESPAEDGMSS